MRLRELERAVIHSRRGGEDPVWIVGGALRDVRLRRPIRDVDLAVAGGEERLARALSALGWGRAFALSRPSGNVPVWRVASPSGTVDVARFAPGATIAQDLARRDFTVNAMARAVGTRGVLDPFGGAADLARGVVRAVSRRNLNDDPLRMLRAYRIAAGRGWSIEPRTRRWIAAGAAGLAGAAPERIHDETIRLFGARDPAAIGWAAEDGVLAAAFGIVLDPPAIRAARSFPARAASRDRDETAVARLAIVLRAAEVGPEAAAELLVARKFSRAEAREVARTSAFLAAIFSGTDPWRSLFAERAAMGPRLRAARDAARTSAERRRFAGLAAVARRARRGEPPIGGHDVERWLGVPPGPEVGRGLERARWKWFRGEWRTRAELRAGLTRRD